MKYFIIIAIIASILIASNNVMAADLLHRITHNDQDSLIIGEVLEMSEDKISVKVVKIISGKKTKEMIEIHTQNSNITPNSYILASIDKSENEYKDKWGIYRVSSKDYRELKILDSDNPDMVALEYYINSGGTYNNFYGIGNKMFIKDNDENGYEIYPNVEEQALKMLDASKNTINKPVKKPIKPYETILYSIGLILIIGVSFIFFSRRSNVKIV